jgi:hypothetical protein
MSIKSIPKMNFSPEALEKMGKYKKDCDQFIIFNTFRNQLIDTNGNSFMDTAIALDKVLGTYHFHNALVERLKKAKREKDAKRENMTKEEVDEISKFAVYEVLDALYKTANETCVAKIREAVATSPIKRFFTGGKVRRTRGRTLKRKTVTKSKTTKGKAKKTTKRRS